MGLISDQSLYEDFARFSKLHLESLDIDPVYPVLKELYRGLDEDEAIWRSFLYVAYYNLSSAATLWNKLEPFEVPSGDDLSLPKATERRNFYTLPRLRAHLEAVRTAYYTFGSFSETLALPEEKDAPTKWTALRKRLEQFPGNGPWASYKLAEILMEVHDYDVSPENIGNNRISGPQKGLILLTGEVDRSNFEEELDRRALELHDLMKSDGLRHDIEHVETSLCDFHSMWKGRYYVGHDIDHMQEQLHQNEYTDSDIWSARTRVFKPKYLGETSGWDGVDRDRCKVYKQEGVVIDR